MKKNKGGNVMITLNKEMKKKSGKGMHPNALCKHIVDDYDSSNKKNLKSNLEGKNLDEFLEIAKLSEKKYEVLNEQILAQTMNTNINKEIIQNQFSGVFLKNAMKNSDIKLYETKPLAIPKRPKWMKGISAMEFDRMEREAFLNWRRALAKEEGDNILYSITPFEKNIEVWRQLWLVVEKCHVLIQIVDGRNPLYFRCPDLEQYIKDVDNDKENILLINKADLMSQEVRSSWADYLTEKGVQFVFFSALDEGTKIEEELEKKEEGLDENSEEDEDDYSEEGDIINKKNIIPSTIVQEINIAEENNAKLTNEENKISSNSDFDGKIKIYNRDELISKIKSILALKTKNSHSNCYYTGFIGYPNVGKSSVINVLMMKKKVGVAQMPGKTKHYQTLFLPETEKGICLMDCPGLVFPTFTTSKADQVVNGIVSIDTIREYHSPIAIIIHAIPRKVLENFYKIELPDIYSATQFLQVLALKRGFISGRALPDEARTSKVVLKDYVSGRLLFCNLRPDYNEETHGVIISYNNDVDTAIILNQEEREKMQLIKEIPADFDDDYDKINIDIDVSRTLKTIKDNFDKMYFEGVMNEHEEIKDHNDKFMNKDMKRALKFAVKRGEITEEEYENAITVGDYQSIVTELQKTGKENKKNLVGVKKIHIN